MIVKQVFVDLDGVLNKFSSYAFQYVGAIDFPLAYDNYPSDCCTWNIVQSVNYLRNPNTPKFTSNTFWGALNRNFWATIPIESYALHLLDYLQSQIGKENVCIASTATLSPECLAGKMDWIYSNLPKWIHRQYMFGRDKYLLARKYTLLIDDNQNNCEKFSEHGGFTCLVPRPWNCLRNVDTFTILNTSLREAFGVGL